ncbi:MAG: type VI secretion system lipoprotein TssJ [Nitrospirae bacterium]|nr:type VI secretion system lipoprotein TssJ [Nitrospirota bacterium]
MKRNILLLFFALLVFLTYSCAGMGRGPEYGYEKEGIIVHLKSDPQLNLYQKSPHTLFLCLYQLKDPNTFNQLMDETDGMQKLLECSRFDQSVTGAKSLVILPNQEKTEKLDRAEGTKYVGIIAGYYTLQKDSVTRFFPVQTGTFSSKPKVLNIDLYLGPQEIKEMEKK